MKCIIALLLVVSMLSAAPCYATDVMVDADGNVCSEYVKHAVAVACGEDAYVDKRGVVHAADGTPIYFLHYLNRDGEEYVAYEPYEERLLTVGTGLDIPPMQQDGVYNCWATCCAMIVNFRRGTNLSTTDIVYSVFPNGPGDRSGGYAECKTVMNKYGLAMGEMEPMTWSQCNKQLQDYGNPIMLVGKNERGGYHDVVVVDSRYAGNIYHLYYNDPWRGIRDYTQSVSEDFKWIYMGGEWVTWEKTRWGFLDMTR